MTRRPNQSAAANRRPAGQANGLDNLSATVAADRAFPAAVAELGRSAPRGRVLSLSATILDLFTRSAWCACILKNESQNLYPASRNTPAASRQS